MPTIASRNSSPFKEMVTVKSERSGGTGAEYEANCTSGKRRLTLDVAAAAQEGPVSTPMKLKSLRRCRNSSPNNPADGSKEYCGSKRLARFCKSPVKRSHNNFDVKQNWNPSDPEQMSLSRRHFMCLQHLLMSCAVKMSRKGFESFARDVWNKRRLAVYTCRSTPDLYKQWQITPSTEFMHKLPSNLSLVAKWPLCNGLRQQSV